MNNTNWDEFEPKQARLRSLVEDVNREMGGAFLRGVSTEAPRLSDAWQRLVSDLAVGTAPELRGCPFCNRRIPSVATRCRYCMKSSEAVSAGGDLATSSR